MPGSCVLTKAEFEARKAELANQGYSVVAYCTAGYRSGQYAAQLAKEGAWAEVLNFEGSILAVSKPARTSSIMTWAIIWAMEAESTPVCWSGYDDRDLVGGGMDTGAALLPLWAGRQGQ